MLGILVGVILFALILPILIVIPISFSSLGYFKFPLEGTSMRWYENFFSSSDWITGFGRSLLIAVISALVATIIGTLAALAINKLEFPGKKAFIGLMVAPMIIPVIIVGIALYHTFGPLGITDSYLGVIMGHSLIGIPMVFITMLGALGKVDSNLELAAMSMGSKPLGVFFKVILPTVKGGIISSSIFAFTTSLDEVVITVFLSGPSTRTLPVVMWENMRSSMDPTICAAATLLILLTLGIFFSKEIGSIFRERKIKEIEE